MKRLRLTILLLLYIGIFVLIIGCSSQKVVETKQNELSGIKRMVLSPLTTEELSNLAHVSTKVGDGFPIKEIDNEFILLTYSFQSGTSNIMMKEFSNAFSDKPLTILYENLPNDDEAHNLYEYLLEQSNITLRKIESNELEKVYKNKRAGESYYPKIWRISKGIIVDQWLNLQPGIDFEYFKLVINNPYSVEELSLSTPIDHEKVILTIDQPILLIEFELWGNEEPIYRLIEELSVLPYSIVPVVNSFFVYKYFPVLHELVEQRPDIELTESRERMYQDWEKLVAEYPNALATLKERWHNITWYEDMNLEITNRFSKDKTTSKCNIYLLDSKGIPLSQWVCKNKEVPIEDESAYVYHQIIEVLKTRFP
ncbi:hypothetical protein SDC9_82956 [bioreactor metagenome]|uniref:Uncharacterized protein n=1 Tax=bioreactor metagenome TaxID=1076179 RepID=A0A644Z6B1_9ZZZZ